LPFNRSLIQLGISLLILVAFGTRLATYTVSGISYHILWTLPHQFSWWHGQFCAARLNYFIFSVHTLYSVICISVVLGYGKSRLIENVESITWLDFSCFGRYLCTEALSEMDANFFLHPVEEGLYIRSSFNKIHSTSSCLLPVWCSSCRTLGNYRTFPARALLIEDVKTGRRPEPEECRTGNFDETWSSCLPLLYHRDSHDCWVWGHCAPDADCLSSLFIVWNYQIQYEIENWISIYRLRGLEMPPLVQFKQNTCCDSG
jgi:hypothetical protein